MGRVGTPSASNPSVAQPVNQLAPITRTTSRRLQHSALNFIGLLPDFETFSKASWYSKLGTERSPPSKMLPQTPCRLFHLFRQEKAGAATPSCRFMRPVLRLHKLHGWLRKYQPSILIFGPKLFGLLWCIAHAGQIR